MNTPSREWLTALGKALTEQAEQGGAGFLSTHGAQQITELFEQGVSPNEAALRLILMAGPPNPAETAKAWGTLGVLALGFLALMWASSGLEEDKS